jgi:hypothetical protein
MPARRACTEGQARPDLCYTGCFVPSVRWAFCAPMPRALFLSSPPCRKNKQNPQSPPIAASGSSSSTHPTFRSSHPSPDRGERRSCTRVCGWWTRQRRVRRSGEGEEEDGVAKEGEERQHNTMWWKRSGGMTMRLREASGGTSARASRKQRHECE